MIHMHKEWTYSCSSALQRITVSISVEVPPHQHTPLHDTLVPELLFNYSHAGMR